MMKTEALDQLFVDDTPVTISIWKNQYQFKKMSGMDRLKFLTTLSDLDGIDKELHYQNNGIEIMRKNSLSEWFDDVLETLSTAGIYTIISAFINDTTIS